MQFSYRWHHIHMDGYGEGALGGPNVWFKDVFWRLVDQKMIEQFEGT